MGSGVDLRLTAPVLSCTVTADVIDPLAAMAGPRADRCRLPQQPSCPCGERHGAAALTPEGHTVSRFMSISAGAGPIKARLAVGRLVEAVLGYGNARWPK
jgi:hypothetical protein